MPKVNQEYVNKKKQMILDSAYKVAMSKPIHEVSMRDIINKTGLSQGGIYRYYSNIDDIFADLINRDCISSIKHQIDNIIEEKIAPEKTISKLINLWENVFLKNLVNVGKIYYELNTLYANDPKRLKEFFSKVAFVEDDHYFQEQSISFISKKIADNYFHPKLSIQDITMFLVTSMDGIVRDLILSRHYQVKEHFPIAESLNESSLSKSLCLALILLLGGDEHLI